MISTLLVPPDLAASLEMVQNRDEFGFAVRDFLDRFRHSPDCSLLEREPLLLAPRLVDEGLADAYVAAVAATLAHENGRLAPAWARGDARALEHPYFAARSPGLRAILLQESPVEFRIRNLFVSANALSRA
jgi:hypothetical protein